MATRRSLFGSLTLCAVFALVSVLYVAGQSDTAVLSGRVADPSGLAIVKARVELVNIDQAISVATETNGAGFYTFPSVKPGRYRMQVSASGFATANLTSLSINVQENIEQNFKLALGSTSESITVEAKGIPVDVATSIGTNVGRQFVKELPMNGRSFQPLIQLTPGVVTTGANGGEQGQFSVNGQRTTANYFMVDGVSANVGVQGGSLGQSAGGALPGFTASGGTNGLVSVDAMQEFSIQTSGYAPEYGRTPGAQISIITRSGTNSFHGTAFDYLRNDVLDANDWFANSLGLKRAELRQNDFGGVVGGPIWKNHTFFFFSYEGLRLRQPTTGISEVPPLDARQAAPAEIKPFMDAFPLPTGTVGPDGFAPADYTFSNPSSLDAVSIRADHRIGSSLTVFGRYNRSTSSLQTRGGGGFEALSEITRVLFKLETVTTGLTWVPGQTLSNEFRFNWSRASNSSIYRLDTLGGAAPFSTSGLFPAGQDPGSSFYEFSIFTGSDSVLKVGRNNTNLQRQLNFLDTLVWQHKNHVVKVGVDYRRLTPQEGVAPYKQQNFFDTVDNAVANRLFGSEVSAYYGPVNALYSNWSIFAQDTWKQKRVIVTYGLRWDYNPTPSATGSHGLKPVAVAGLDDLSTLALAPLGTPLYHATRDNFAPRLGVAYHLKESNYYGVLLRAGFGMFYDLGNGPTGDAFSQFPFNNLQLRECCLIGAGLPLPPSVAAPPPPTLNPPFGFVLGFPHTLRQPYSYHWNLGYQQAIGLNNTLSLSYLGAAGHSNLRRSLITGGNLNPDFSGVYFVDNSGFSKYDALQAQFRRHQSNRLEVLASYTYAHALDNVSTDAAPVSTLNVSPARDYGNSDFDIRHTGTFAIDYQLPFPAHTALLRKLLNGWGVNTLVIARTAVPVDVEVTRNLGFGFQNYRPDAVSGVPRYLSDPTAPGGRLLNAAAFAVSPEVRQGFLGRNDLRGFSLFQQDFSVRRTFSLGETVHLQFRMEAFNILNHPNFAPPASVLGFFDGTTLFPMNNFGRSEAMFNTSNSPGGLGLNGAFNPLYQIGGPRSLQAALKLEF